QTVAHQKLGGNRDVEKAILDVLGVPYRSTDIVSGGFVSGTVSGIPSLWTLLNDPVDGFLVDAAGRRLGFSSSTGPVTEIPGSIWLGDQDGTGWVQGSVQQPAHVELTGRGENYTVALSASE